MENNSIEIPNWLNKMFIIEFLENMEQSKSIELKNFHINLATAKGQNYGSDMYRINVIYNCVNNNNNNNNDYQISTTTTTTTTTATEQKHEKNNEFIIKIAYETEFANQILNPFNVYQKEMEIYDKYLPIMKRQLDNANIQSNHFPRPIHVSYPTKSIVFEDLTRAKYFMLSSVQRLDMAHAKLVLTALAKFHGSAAVLPKSTITKLKLYNGMLSRTATSFTNFYLTSYDALIDFVNTKWNRDDNANEEGNSATLSNSADYYVKKLKRLRCNLIENGQKSFDCIDNNSNNDDDGRDDNNNDHNEWFYTLIHGDIWTNNTMFRYKTNDDINNNNNSVDQLKDEKQLEPENVMLIDFQFCCWSSPTIDLHYFFNTSLRDELRLNHQDELLQWYHLQLTETLRALNFNGFIPNLFQFQIQFIQTSFYGLISALLVQPLMINENIEDADISALHGTDERAIAYKRLIFNNEIVQNNIRQLLPIYDRKGLLDLY